MKTTIDTLFCYCVNVPFGFWQLSVIDFRPHRELPATVARADSEPDVIRSSAKGCWPLGHRLRHHLFPGAKWRSRPGRLEQGDDRHQAKLWRLPESAWHKPLWWLQENVLAFCKSCMCLVFDCCCLNLVLWCWCLVSVLLFIVFCDLFVFGFCLFVCVCMCYLVFFSFFLMRFAI